MTAEENIKKLNIVLPEAKPPVGNYVATKISGKLLFISGQISIDDNVSNTIKLAYRNKINILQTFLTTTPHSVSKKTTIRLTPNGAAFFPVSFSKLESSSFI